MRFAQPIQRLVGLRADVPVLQQGEDQVVPDVGDPPEPRQDARQRARAELWSKRQKRASR